MHPGSDSLRELDREAARSWIDRWDRQQEGDLAAREDRFTALIDVVEEGAGSGEPLVLDLGCGPGSLAVRLLDRIPTATVVAVDADPVMLALARAAHDGRKGLRFVDADLRLAGWSDALELERPADVAVSTTALHWLNGPELAAMYAELSRVLRPAGLLLNGDQLKFDSASFPTLTRLECALLEREDKRRSHGCAEDWEGWWQAVTADSALAAAVSERARRGFDHPAHGSSSELFTTHADALQAAGFAEVGTLWQHGENRLICAVLGG